MQISVSLSSSLNPSPFLSPTMKSNNGATSPHIAILPSPGMGHLTPFAELAKRLVSLHGLSVTFITYSSSISAAKTSLLSSLPPSISSLSLPPVSLSDAPPDSRIETLLSLEASLSLPSLASVLKDLHSKTHIVAFIADIFGTDSFDVAREFGIPCYQFMPSNLLMLSLMLHLPTLDSTTTGEYRDLPAPLQLPGCVPIPGADLVQPLQERTNECHRWMVHHGKRFHEAKGILVNSFESIEPGACKVLSETKPGWPPVYVIGPLVRVGSADTVDKSGCINWLDRQPVGSVLYVSFGSGGALTKEQMGELAFGLESSGQRFLWVVRSPIDAKVVGTNYLDLESKKDPLGFLPHGFVERTREVGMLVHSWAPQIRVLGHPSTGGFVTHCGWNSTLESVVNGVPMIVWPLYAEQRQNAVMLVDGIGAALRPKGNVDGLVDREEIARVVTELMKGEEGVRVREKVKQLQEAADRGLKEGGASYEALQEVASKWKGASG